MQATLLACLTAVCGTSALATPGITLLDGQHSIIGGAMIYDPAPDVRNYSDSSTYDAIGGLPALHGSARFGLDVYAASWADTLSLRVEADSYGGQADAQAQGMWLFQPKWNTLELCFNCFVYGDDPTFAELIDQTTGTSLYLWDDQYGPPDYIWDGVSMTFAVDPSHLYSLEASLSVGSYDDGYFYSAMNAAVVPVPGALLLGVLGTALVGRWRQR